MKAGLVTSTILHAVLLGVGLFSLSAPRAFEVMDVESCPVEIVPIEEISQAQVGEREAPAAEAPAPVPTTRPEPVENAEQVGLQRRPQCRQYRPLFDHQWALPQRPRGHRQWALRSHPRSRPQSRPRMSNI